jgi:hypothetical protein
MIPKFPNFKSRCEVVKEEKKRNFAGRGIGSSQTARLACRRNFVQVTSCSNETSLKTTRWLSTEPYVPQDVPAVGYHS